MGCGKRIQQRGTETTQSAAMVTEVRSLKESRTSRMGRAGVVIGLEETKEEVDHFVKTNDNFLKCVIGA